MSLSNNIATSRFQLLDPVRRRSGIFVIALSFHRDFSLALRRNRRLALLFQVAFKMGKLAPDSIVYARALLDKRREGGGGELWHEIAAPV